MVEAGAVGYLVKGCPMAELIDGIHLAARRQSTLSAEAAAHVLDEFSHKLQREQDIAAERQQGVERIQRAVAGEGLHAVFQPIFDLSSRRPFAYEALARFTGAPKRPPDQWFAGATAGQLVELSCARSRRRPARSPGTSPTPACR
jgi:predicted signal transduction protein with EAL and GGDEF domain